LESEDTNAACVSGNGEISINFDEEAASDESENQISTGQLNEYESLLNTVRSLEAKLESRINDLASEVHETRLELHVEKIARGNLEAEYTELASEALEIRSELDIRNLTRDENENIKSRDESISTVFNKGFLVKENASLTDENALLKQQINNYKCITLDLRTKVKDLENEKDSLVTVIQILHDDQNQHTCHANKSIASWNVVNNHKRSKIGRGSSKNYSTIGPSGDIRDKDGATRIKNQYIVLSDDIDNSEASEDDSVILKSTQAPQNKEIQDTSKERPKDPKHGCVAASDSKTVTSTDELVDIFNDHFSNIGPKLAESIPNDNDVSFRDFITQQKSKTKNSFSFRPVSVTLVYTLLVNLSTTKATGMDKISAKILQVAAPVIAPSLTEIFNMSIDSDQFPSGWKAARVIPLFKKGQRSMLDNYRPISILPVVSKLMERIMYDQMYEYLNQNNLFSKHQFGFRPYIIPQLLHYCIVRTNGIPTWTVGCIT
ncbi:Hypothetical predicted protein, partial [Paramuricea clavata]